MCKKLLQVLLLCLVYLHYQLRVVLEEHLPISVWVGDDKNEFFGKCSGTAAITLQGTTCDIEIDANGIPLVDENATSKNVLLIVGKHPEDNWGAGTRVRFKINPAKSQYSA